MARAIAGEPFHDETPRILSGRSTLLPAVREAINRQLLPALVGLLH